VASAGLGTLTALLLAAQAWLLAEVLARGFDGEGLAAVRGALIALLVVVFARAVTAWLSEAVAALCSARVKSELIYSIFIPASPIHDGALVIQKGRVTAVRCLLPLSTNPNLRKTWGTRHRAALGVTEETDAVAIVASEQEGTAALVVGGNVTENIDPVRLRSALQDLLKP